MAKRHNASFAAVQARQEAEKAARRTSTNAPTTAASTLEVHEARYHFWLVQRLEPNRRPGRGWFNHMFELDYMGSSEFEFGAPHRSLKRMRELGGFQIVSVQLTRNDVTKTVYCIAPSRDMAHKITDFIGWATPDYPRAKESTNFDVLFDENFRLVSRKYIRTVAWWSLDDGFLWALDREVAEQLLYGLEHPATS